jgi:hypothetical protein
MADYLVELYVARDDAASLEVGPERAQRAAEELTRQGTPVRFVRSLFVPEDETCLFLYEAGSAADVRDAVTRAGLSFERVVEAMPSAVGRES